MYKAKISHQIRTLDHLDPCSLAEKLSLFLLHLCLYRQGDACDSCPSLPEGNGNVAGFPGPKGERGEPGLPGEGREGKQVQVFLYKCKTPNIKLESTQSVLHLLQTMHLVEERCAVTFLKGLEFSFCLADDETSEKIRTRKNIFV